MKEKLNSQAQQLLKSIKQKEELLKTSYFKGTHIPRHLIPAKYVVNYGVTNLWKINLTGYWRMVYTIRTEPQKTRNIVLDIIDHAEYDRIFGYEKR